MSREAAEGSEWSHGTFAKMVSEVKRVMISFRTAYGYETFK